MIGGKRLVASCGPAAGIRAVENIMDEAPESRLTFAPRRGQRVSDGCAAGNPEKML